MLRVNIYIERDHYEKLKKLPGNIAEHVRFAINEYLKKQENFSASKSIGIGIGGKNE